VGKISASVQLTYQEEFKMNKWINNIFIGFNAYHEPSDMLKIHLDLGVGDQSIQIKKSLFQSKLMLRIIVLLNVMEIHHLSIDIELSVTRRVFPMISNICLIKGQINLRKYQRLLSKNKSLNAVVPGLNFKEPRQSTHDGDGEDGQEVADAHLAPRIDAGIGIVILNGMSEINAAIWKWEDTMKLYT
jgi:hypothetical protein